MLLAHTSGMNSGADYRTIAGENVERFALARELVAAPGERVIYSDLGFIALGSLISRVAGCDLSAATRRTFGSPTLGSARAPRSGRRFPPPKRTIGAAGYKASCTMRKRI